MKNKLFQTGIGLAGLITLLLFFVVFAFSAGWLANKYYANRLYLVRGTTPDFPYVIDVNAKPDGMTWNGQQLIFSNRVSPWGVVRITPLENGQYRKTSIPVVEKDYQQQVSIQGIAWNGTSYVALTSGDWFQSEHEKVFVELDPLTFQITRVLARAPEYAQCIAWDGINYWAGTRLHTADQKGRSVLYKFDVNLKTVAEFEGAGVGCQGMTWDGKYLWWGDVFSDTITLYNISNTTAKSPVIVHQYKLSINQQSGIAFDGKDIWFGDYKKQQLVRLNQELYFDWLGNRFEITDPGQMMLLERFGNYQSGSMSLDDMIKPLLDGKIKIEDIPEYVDTLRSRYSNDEVRLVLINVRNKVTQADLISILDQELNDLVDVGNIDYKDSIPVEDNSIKMKYFNGTVKEGNLIVNWKIIVGSVILSGVDAPRPQQLPDDYEFDTFIQYQLRITDQQSGDTQEYEYDIFGDEDVQENVILLEGIIPGEYKIEIETKAQYYTETRANLYNGMFELKVTY
jgi:hypothetical protein